MNHDLSTRKGKGSCIEGNSYWYSQLLYARWLQFYGQKPGLLLETESKTAEPSSTTSETTSASRGSK